jgi:hypothetical protein
VRLLLLTVGGEFVEPIDQLGETFFAYRSITLIDRLPSRAQRLAVRMKTTKQTALKGKTHVKKRSHG